jgi:hypothetical protein
VPVVVAMVVEDDIVAVTVAVVTCPITWVFPRPP